LNRRALHRAEGTEHAAIPTIRAQQNLTSLALVIELASIVGITSCLRKPQFGQVKTDSRTTVVIAAGTLNWLGSFVDEVFFDFLLQLVGLKSRLIAEN
jgi:hypothetical protein